MDGLTIPSPIHLSKTWFNSFAVHGITGASPTISPSGLFLFTLTDVVMAWGTATLFVLRVNAVLLVLYSRSTNWVMHRFLRLSL